MTALVHPCPHDATTARGWLLYPYDSLVTTKDAARLLNRTESTIRSWALRYNLPKLGRTRQRETLYDYRIVSAVEKAIRNAEPVPTDWTEFTRRLAA